MVVSRPIPKNKPYSNRATTDILQIVPITSDKKILLVELLLPKDKRKYRLLENHFKSTEDLDAQIKQLTEKAGIRYDDVKLVKKGQPFNVGRYAQDKAVYVFRANNVQINKDPELGFLTPYSLKQFSFGELEDVLQNKFVENQLLLDLRTLLV